MVLYIVYNARNVKKIILYLLVIGFLATISIPVYLEHSTQIQNKFEGGKGEKYGSRSAHFGEGFEKLNESPPVSYTHLLCKRCIGIIVCYHAIF